MRNLKNAASERAESEQSVDGSWLDVFMPENVTYSNIIYTKNTRFENNNKNNKIKTK